MAFTEIPKKERRIKSLAKTVKLGTTRKKCLTNFHIGVVSKSPKDKKRKKSTTKQQKQQQ